MKNAEWKDYGAITGPLIATLVLLLLAFAPVLDSRMLNLIKDLMPILTGVMAVLVACLAYRIARQQLRIATFEKRHAVYAAVKDLILACLSTVADKDIREYRAATASAEFLFDKDGLVAAYVELLRLKAIDFITLLGHAKRQNEENAKTGLDNVSDEQKRNQQELWEKVREVRGWFDKQYDEAKSKFAKHLSLE